MRLLRKGLQFRHPVLGLLRSGRRRHRAAVGFDWGLGQHLPVRLHGRQLQAWHEQGRVR